MIALTDMWRAAAFPMRRQAHGKRGDHQPGLGFKGPDRVVADGGETRVSMPGSALKTDILTAPGGPLGDIADTLRRNVAALADGTFYIHSAAIHDPQARSLQDRARRLGILLRDPEPVELSVIREIYGTAAIRRLDNAEGIKARFMAMIAEAVAVRTSDIQVKLNEEQRSAEVRFQIDGFLSGVIEEFHHDELEALITTAFYYGDNGDPTPNPSRNQKVTVNKRHKLPAGVFSLRLHFAKLASGRHLNIRIVYEKLAVAGQGLRALGLPADIERTLLYVQTHVVIVHRTGANQLQALAMTCGGTAIGDQPVRHLIALAGGPIKGGGIPAVGVLSTNPAVAIGANGGLSLALTNFAGTACPPTPGHIGAALFLDGSQIMPPFLFRDPVPGAGSAPNTMNTVLFMGGNDIQTVHDIYSSTKQRWLGQAIQDAVQGGDGLVIAKPSCPNGVPQIFTSPVAFSDNGVGLPLIGVQTYAVDNGATWTAHLVVITQNASGNGSVRVTPGVGYGQILALAKCT